MRKSTNELTTMMNEIVERKNKYYFTMKEMGEIFGLSRNTISEMCKKIPEANLNGSKKYYIGDILRAVYK